MKETINYIKYMQQALLYVLFIVVLTPSCKKMLDVDPPKSKIANELAFSDDLTAAAVARGMYADMLDFSHFANGTYTSLTGLAGLSADELVNNGLEASLLEFEQNNLSRDNDRVLALWKSMYKSVYDANSIIEGLNASTNLSDQIKTQLTGEALFVRAFAHFYLVNLFGKVPLITTTDYRMNSKATREEVNVVYAQIEKDLLEAQGLLNDAYDGNSRVRPNKGAATALLARVYLYTQQWAKAEVQATDVINDANYGIVDLNSITLANNNEAIWQLHPSIPTYNPATNEAVYFFYGAYYNSLRPDFVNSFEAGDARSTSWIQFDGTYYLPYKYQAYYDGTDRAEYSTVMRLAEQYLIRSEARARQGGDLSGAIADVDTIRNRAGLPLITNTNPGISQGDLLDAIEKERKAELFTEWGHRWLDLKRYGHVVTALSGIKTGLNSDDELYPVPQSEFDKNPQLGDQNPGY